MLAQLLPIWVFWPCLPCQHPSVTRIARKNSHLVDLPASRGHLRPLPGAQCGNPMLRAKCCLASRYLRTISTGRPGSGAPAKVLVFMQLFRSPPHYVMWCGPIDLVTMSPRRLRLLPIGNGGPAAREDVMTWKFPVANKLAVLLAAGAVVAVGFDITPASAQSKPRYDDRGRP